MLVMQPKGKVSKQEGSLLLIPKVDFKLNCYTELVYTEFIEVKYLQNEMKNLKNN